MLSLSIVTVHFGPYRKLQDTIKSVKEAFGNESKVEHIVIDGTPHPKEVYLKDCQKHFVLVQELDSGIFNAMNKGLSIAKGKYVLFLNSGDILNKSNNLPTFFKRLQTENIIWFNFNAFTTTKDGVNIPWQTPTRFKFEFALNSYCHQAQLIRRVELLEMGGFNENSLVADWEVTYKLARILEPSYLEQLSVTCEAREFSQKYSIFAWANNISRFKYQNLNSTIFQKLFQVLIQFVIAFILSIRKIFIRKNFYE